MKFLYKTRFYSCIFKKA